MVQQNDFRKPAISYQQSAISLGKGIEKRRAQGNHQQLTTDYAEKHFFN